jgi:hypothetical protein
MKTFYRWAALACAVLFLVLALGLSAQTPSQIQSEVEIHIKYNSGQEIVPIFEGWERVPDGSFNMVFGYLNRNHVQQLSIPPGPQNSFQPGPVDRGQPGYFYARENHWQFRVNVPKDWGKTQELVWTITANGKTERARASLLDVYEVDRKVEAENNGGNAATTSDELLLKNERPAIKIGPVAVASVGTPLNLTAEVTDDGIPAPRPARGAGGAGRDTTPTLRGAPPSPVNVPLPAAPRPPAAGGLSLLWIVYRGPAGVAFDPDGYTSVKDGKVAAKATFTQRGTYVIRAIAFDGMLRNQENVTVNVN